jgi:sister-chromatid-cohesion protein PDS5
LPSKPDDEQAWVDRFLLVASRLDNGVLKTLDRLTGIYGYAKGSSPYRAFVETCEKWNGGGVEDGNDKQIKRNLDFIMDAIAQTLFGDADKARKDLERFATINEPRLYKLFRSLVDPQTGLRETIKARNELLRRIEQSHTSILETFSVVIDSAAWMIVNQSSIPGFIKRIQRPEGSDPERTAQMAAHYLALIAKHCAPMFKSHVPVLVIIVNDKKNDTLVEIGFQALAAVCKWDTECAPTQKGVLERAKTVALNGTPRQAKFAARFLVYCKDPKAAPNLVEVSYARW